MKHSIQTLAAVLVVLAGLQAGLADEPQAIHVEIVYSYTLDAIPDGARSIDLWMPVPTDTDGQTVSKAEVVWPGEGLIATDPTYGNRMYHIRFEAPFDGKKIGAELRFDIRRTAIEIPQAKTIDDAVASPPVAVLAAYLAPNASIPLDGKIDQIAGSLHLDGLAPMAAARRIYDYLIDEMTYNWQAPGAGQGNVLWACDSKTGDCTDYHSMFLALCRNRGIPADHEFGYPIRSDKPEGKIPSYHCWARFYVDGVGWVPIDASEADKHPELREFNFGSQGAKLIKFTHGRDVVLEPPQQGPPLNVFIHPYVEIDGVPQPKPKYTVTYRMLPL